MKNWLKITLAVAALIAAYFSGHHYGYVDGVIEATADCIITYQPSSRVGGSQSNAF